MNPNVTRACRPQSDLDIVCALIYSACLWQAILGKASGCHSISHSHIMDRFEMLFMAYTSVINVIQ